MRSVRGLALLLAVAVVAAACGDDGGGPADRDATPDADACGLAELAARGEDEPPVEITFWHQQVDENQATVEAMVAEFDAARPDITVRVVQYPDYPDLFGRWVAGLETGNVADIAVFEETTLQFLVDSGSTVPIETCVQADDYDLSDHLPRALSYYTLDDALRAMPFNVSNPILFYNRAAFTDAGLDPAAPPETLDEVREISAQLVDSGATTHGIALRQQHFLNEFWYAKGGQVYVNNDNGRSARATEAQLDTEFGLELWTWWREMVDEGLAVDTGSAVGNIDHLLALGNRDAAMAIDGSGAIGPILAVLGTGQFGDVEFAAAPLPGLRPGGGVPVGDGALWISSSSPPERRAAAWELAKHLVEVEQQVRLHLSGGYVPVRLVAAEDPRVQERWAEEPAFRAAWDQLVEGPEGPATAGSVIGDYQGVRDAVVEGLNRMLARELDPADALALAQRRADEAIASYNRRIGE